MLRGILIFVVVVVFLLAQAPSAWRTVRDIFGLDEWNWWSRDAVTAPERAKELASKGLREQLISFEDGMTALEYRYGARPETQRYDVFALGVGQITLGEPESSDKVEKVTVTGTRLKNPEELPAADALPTYPISGQFNNVLIYDRRDGSFLKLFDKRLAVTSFQYGWRTKPEVLIVFATERDTDGDGKLGGADLQDIYVYTFADKKLHRVDTKGLNPSEIVDIPDADFVVVKALRDRNGDGKTIAANTYQRKGDPEPTVLIRIDLKTFTASSFVPDNLMQELQKTLDGAAAPEKGKP